MKLVGVPEIAQMFMIGQTDVMSLMDKHHDFPEPIADLQNGPVWERNPVRRWAKRNSVFVVPEPDEVTYPIKLDFYVGTSKSDNDMLATRMGLPVDAANRFRYTGLEVKLSGTVDEHGVMTVTHFEDVALEKPVVITP